MSRVLAAVGVCLLAFGCSGSLPGEVQLSIRPRVLNDDGSKAHVEVSALGGDGRAGLGKIRLHSTAGSLRQGLELTLQGGAVSAELSCAARDDADCADKIVVTAEWLDQPSETSVSLPVFIHSVDALTSACAFANRRKLTALQMAPPKLQLAVLDSPPEVRSIGPHGAASFDEAQGIGTLVMSLPAVGLTASAQEAYVRGKLFGTVELEDGLTQTFTTWDNFEAVNTTFQFQGVGTLRGELDVAAMGLLGLPTGLSATGGVGPFKGELTVVSYGTEVGVVLSLTPLAGFDEHAGFQLDDVAGGSGLAQSVDTLVDHCEIFTATEGTGRKVDFVWVVDDSCSMQTSQAAVGRVGAEAAQRLANAEVDWRAAGITTGYYPPAFQGSVRGWTADAGEMVSWFSGGQAWGTGGSATEEGFPALQQFLRLAVDGGYPSAFRPDAVVHAIFMSDTHDNSEVTATQMLAQLRARFGADVVAHAIVCPESGFCGDEQEDAVGKYHTLVRATGGVLANIRVFSPRQLTTQLLAQQQRTIDAIVGSVIGRLGVSLQYRPLAVSLRVAASATAGTCANRDIPRSVVNGWDLDGLSGKLVFYGACRPLVGSNVVVSYQSWLRSGTAVHDWTEPVRVVVTHADAGVDGGRLDSGVVDGGVVDGGVFDSGTNDSGHE